LPSADSDYSWRALRDSGFYKKERFNRLLKSNPDITPRVPATRLKELEAGDLIRIVEKGNSPMIVRWGLTQKGIDAIPILMMVATFCSKYEAEKVFVDKDFENSTNFSTVMRWSWSGQFL